MKIRSLFLCTCMTVVPLTALLSHRLPEGVMQAAGGFVATVCGGAESGMAGPPSPLAESGTGEFTEAFPAEVTSAPTSPATTVAPSENLLAGPMPVANPTPPPTSAATHPDNGLLDIRRRLAAAGATSVECRPLPGTGDGFTATCRVGVDAGGSLFRMFQANGSDPSSAFRALLEAVEIWRERATFR
jgi:hypothetical protein